MELWTGTVTGAPLVIDKSDGVYRASFLAKGGAIGITGTFTFKGVPSTQIQLADGQAVDLGGPGTTPMAVTIDPLAASVDAIIFMG